VSATRKAIQASSAPFDIALADRAGARRPPLRRFAGARLADLDSRHAVPQRQTAGGQHHEIIAKDAVAREPLGIRVTVGLEGGDAPAPDVGNINGHAR
jgi:hypothetical protein